MRTKEFAFDYRYFPEPDLVPLEPSAEWVDSLRRSMPEYAAARRARFASQYGLGEKDIEVLAGARATADWFEEAAGAYDGDAKKIVNWIIADLFGLLNEAGIELHESKIAPKQLAAMVKMIDAGAISGKQAKLVLQGMFESGHDPEEITREKGLEQVSDVAQLEGVVDEVISENPEAADKVRAGQLNTIGFLVGRVMKKTRGQANPGLVNELLRSKLT